MVSENLRLMEVSDLEMVRGWRNHPEIRRYMYTTHKISVSEHRAWFSGVAGDPRVTLLIYEDLEQPLGFVNLTRGPCAEVADWGFYVAPNAPKGTGRALGKRALNFAFMKLDLHKICGQAIDFNQRSIAFHRALGFAEEGRLRDQFFDGRIFHDVMCFGLLKHEWYELIEE